MKKVRWWRIVAIALGVWLALWLLGGDRTPDAAEPPPLTLRVQRISVENGIAFYRLTGEDGGAGVLAVDTNVAFSNFLATHRSVTVR